MNSVCVFAGSSMGALPDYASAAHRLGTALAARGTRLIYGGGGSGLMGVLADAVLEHGGHVTGIIPAPLAGRELAHSNLSELRVVGSMHERKAAMARDADAFIALPGGLGTLEEFMEVWTWAQLGIHTRPCGLLNVAGYYDALLRLVDHLVDEAFLDAKYRRMIVLDDDPQRLLEAIDVHEMPPVERWLKETES